SGSSTLSSRSRAERRQFRTGRRQHLPDRTLLAVCSPWDRSSRSARRPVPPVSTSIDRQAGSLERVRLSACSTGRVVPAGKPPDEFRRKPGSFRGLKELEEVETVPPNGDRVMKPVSSPILQSIRRFVEDERAGQLSDQILLQRFSEQRDESAFGTLLGRHGSMVLDVCRSVL